MPTIELDPLIRAAGFVQILIASANFFARRMFRYGDELRSVSRFVREVFVVHNVFIVFVLLGMAALSIAFPAELAGGSSLGRSLSAFLALFWGLRLGVQVFYYDGELRRRYRAFDVLFCTAFAYLIAVFALASCAGS